MITTLGKLAVKRYFAGATPTLVGSMAFGIGNSAESLTSTGLQFEVARSNISLVSFDYVNSRWICKAQIPTAFVGTIYETGVFSKISASSSGAYGSGAISSFNSATEKWVDGSGNPSTFTTALARWGTDWLTLSANANGNSKAILNNVNRDFSGNSGTDQFNFAFNVGSNVSSLSAKFQTDASNYYQYTINSPAAGYNMTRIQKSAATVTGSPSWGNINSIELQLNSTSGGASSLSMEGIRIEDVDYNDPDYIMVSRKVLATPFIITPGRVQEAEFYIGLSV